VVGNWWVGTATQACEVSDALSDELSSLVSEVTQAVHVSLWLRPDLPSGGTERHK
jgi:hypothetical protein